MNPTKWKYEIVIVKPAMTTATVRERLKQTLEEMGTKGWELVTAPQMVSALVEITLVFKRPV